MKLARISRRLRETEDVQDDAAWLEAVLDIVAPEMDGGLGVVASRFDVSDLNRFRVHPLGVALPAGLDAAQVATATMRAPPAYVQASYRVFDCITTSEAGSACEREFISSTYDHGYQDALSVGAILPDDTGCMFLAGRKTRTSVGRRARDQWRAFTQELREVLARRAAIRQAERADPPIVDDELTKSAAWQQLRSEGWVRLRSYRVDQRRLVLLSNRNRTSVLTPRERQVALLASTGLANKVIGFDLGIATSTVAVLLSRAMHKFGVATRGELARVLQDLASVE